MPVCYAYMVRCSGGALYTGWTTDLARRLAAHQSGKGAKYTRAFGAASLAWAEALPDKSAALRREAALKKLPKKRPWPPPSTPPASCCCARQSPPTRPRCWKFSAGT